MTCTVFGGTLNLALSIYLTVSLMLWNLVDWFGVCVCECLFVCCTVCSMCVLYVCCMCVL